MFPDNLSIVVVCNKRDFFLTRICIASIRFYYSHISISIVKDYNNGYFNSRELEKAFDVEVIDLGITNYGWAAAKMHLLLSEVFKGKRFLMLDSDVVLAGRFFEKLNAESKNFDFAVSAVESNNPYDPAVYSLYYNLDNFQKISPAFKFPGYFFNTGQMIATGGLISGAEIANFFDPTSYPYWKNLKDLPCVDQSLLNYLLPFKEQKNQLKIYKASFMLWSESIEAKELDIDKVAKGETYSFVIHWAGALRVPYIAKMTRGDILAFFQNYYYSRIKFGWYKRTIRSLSAIIQYYLFNVVLKWGRKFFK